MNVVHRFNTKRKYACRQRRKSITYLSQPITDVFQFALTILKKLCQNDSGTHSAWVTYKPIVTTARCDPVKLTMNCMDTVLLWDTEGLSHTFTEDETQQTRNEPQRRKLDCGGKVSGVDEGSRYSQCHLIGNHVDRFVVTVLVWTIRKWVYHFVQHGFL